LKQSKKYLVVVAGPTAVGKTALCIRLAKRLRTVILSADSRQFFRELSIGTAKPTSDELAQVKHYFIDSHSIKEPYSAGDYERDALTLLDELFQTYDLVIVTGGSGLYLKALLEGLDDLPQVPSEVRQTLMNWLSEEGLESLQKELRRVDPVFAASPEIHNPQRVVRALEVWQATGVPISTLQKQVRVPRPFQPILIALQREREELYQRINQRVDVMLQGGLIEEVNLVRAYRAHHALQTVGYKEVFAYFDGSLDYATMVALIKQNTRRYAKRQLTWFRHQGDYTWFDAEDEEAIWAFVRNVIA
jgi:tRNA dimethylallyltransferase